MSIFNENMLKTPYNGETFFIDPLTNTISKEQRFRVKSFFKQDRDLRQVYIMLMKTPIEEIEEGLSHLKQKEIRYLSHTFTVIKERLEKSGISLYSKILRIIAKFFRIKFKNKPYNLEKIKKIDSLLSSHIKIVDEKPDIDHKAVAVAADVKMKSKLPPITDSLKSELKTFLSYISPKETKTSLQKEFNRLALEAKIEKIGDREYKISLDKPRKISGVIPLYFRVPVTITVPKETVLKFSKGTGRSSSEPDIATEQMRVAIHPPLEGGKLGGKIAMIASDHYISKITGKPKSTIVLGDQRIGAPKFAEQMKSFHWDS